MSDNLDQLIQTVQSDGTAGQEPAQTPEKVGEIEYEKFAEAAKTFYGVEDPLALKDYGSLSEKNKTLSAKIAEYEEKSKKNPFADPWVEKMNNFIASGGSRDQLVNYLRLQVPGEELKGIDAIKMSMKLSDPNMPDAVINAKIKQSLGTGDFAGLEDEELEMAQAEYNQRLQLAEYDALQNIEKLKSEYTLPDPIQINSDQEQRRAQLQSGWEKVIPKMNIPSIPISFDHKELGEYSFNYNPSQDAKAVEQLQGALIQEVVKAGLPLEEGSIAQVRQMAQGLVLLSNMQDIMKQLVHDVYAKTTKKFVDAEAGTGSAGSSDQKKTPPPPKRPPQVAGFV